MHEKLARQLKDVGLALDGLPPTLRRLLEDVSAGYVEADRSRSEIERTLAEATAELRDANATLRRDAAELEQRVELRTTELKALNQSLQREITVRRLAEQAIRKSEARFRSLFEDSRDAILISTPTGRLLDINPTGIALLGYESKEQMLRIDTSYALYEHPTDHRRFLAELEEAGFVQDLPIRIRRKDDSLVDVLLTATGVRDADGSIAAYRGIFRDVTLQRALEKRLLRSQRLEAVGRLAGGVAHDFNNLLTAILGYGELLVRDLPADSPLERRAEEIRLAAERGARLTRQLLALSRRQVLRKTVIDLNEVVTDMDQLLRRLIGEDIALRSHLDEELAPVRADRSQIEQVILNLAVNARDAMPQGGVLTLRTKSVRIGSARPSPIVGLEAGDYAMLEVSDNGTGIDEAIREKIFEPFFTTKEPGAGTGLGLATVCGIVEQSDGVIEVATRAGMGTTFRVYLPRTDEAAATPSVESKAAGTSAHGTETILLAEDEPAVRMLIAQYLGDHGYTVLTASSGEDALSQADRHVGPIDLLVTDIVMGGMTGAELARELQHRRPSTRALLISGYAEGLESLGEPDAGAAPWAFLQKPFATDLLVRRMRLLLDETVRAT